MAGKLPPARGRLNGSGPIAVIDIGSNSVRLVVYERRSRTPTTLFNEKVLAGLGRGVASTGKLAEASVAMALAALKRFRSLCEHIGIESLYVIATAAARDASNGPQFVQEVESILGVPVRILDGGEEAYYSALGVIAGVWKPCGIVGDMGGGSLELVKVDGAAPYGGQTFPLGGLRLQEESEGDIVKAQKIAEDSLSKYVWPELNPGERNFYAVGGTWRSLARMHMAMKGYPMHVMHNYEMSAAEAADFCKLLMEHGVDSLEFANVVSKQRRPLLPFGAVVMEAVLRGMKADKVVLSAAGVREGLLHENLPQEIQDQDPVVEAARELAVLRARSPEHAEELIAWTDGIFKELKIDETEGERRLRHAACLLSDLGWRAHPDYRGEQSLNIIANATFVGVDHPGRAYLAAAVFYRHQGLGDGGLSPAIRSLSTERLRERARILGAALRVASVLSASIAGILPRTSVLADEEVVLLRIPASLAPLDGERVRKRFAQLAKLLGTKGMIAVLPA
ncbi:Ppx/GppA phosphatase family protein [Roseibium suaedae]|uniref:Exopolyphosphatase / guanosine-5'-triphosphate,3'-diphosphate pyrophosphatase n=1 Tax=Roseibium suaedae TaxID=735517 RepID=A0A1M7LCY5_9HYPH|nr:Ppx/GppA phosphatase family protein [Roseibium suaedae]SHM76023.1 exopolyphosphatase / guanosine-5'-triphosphate,3'-diphosphate pyrophosphatase [Roseibium suaedae]